MRGGGGGGEGGGEGDGGEEGLGDVLCFICLGRMVHVPIVAHPRRVSPQ